MSFWLLLWHYNLNRSKQCRPVIILQFWGQESEALLWSVSKAVPSLPLPASTVLLLPLACGPSPPPQPAVHLWPLLLSFLPLSLVITLGLPRDPRIISRFSVTSASPLGHAKLINLGIRTWMYLEGEMHYVQHSNLSCNLLLHLLIS